MRKDDKATSGVDLVRQYELALCFWLEIKHLHDRIHLKGPVDMRILLSPFRAFISNLCLYLMGINTQKYKIMPTLEESVCHSNDLGGS
jgi:hypothetical protein